MLILSLRDISLHATPLPPEISVKIFQIYSCSFRWLLQREMRYKCSNILLQNALSILWFRWDVLHPSEVLLLTATMEASGSAQPGMCHSHGEAKHAGNMLWVPRACVSLPSTPCARAGWGHTSFYLIPNVQETQVAASWSSINSSGGSLCRCPKSSQSLKVRINKIYGWNCWGVFL